jgi:hypothetical protein
MKKNKNIGAIGYVVLCIVICIIPFAGMAVAPTNTTTENKVLASFPALQNNGKWNLDWLSEAGEYFEDHFAFRQYLVTADSEVQSRVFGVSNMDTVINGTDGWLYYSATLEDYLGENTMSDRGIFNIAHNISLMEQYVESQGSEFLFTIAPNKNSLYGEDMPYYDQKIVSTERNQTLLEPILEEQNVSYVDLFSLFEAEDEILYLKRDSHWNQKGAVLAYNALLDGLNLEHETYETVRAVRTKTEYGDLNKMLYPKSAEPEWNYTYEKEQEYQYVTDTESVEEAWIETENNNGSGSLLMFRDSFGNTLLPLMADVFENGYFSKSTPYAIESYLNEYSPETVLVEKVERNISDFATDPPLMTGLLVTEEDQDKEVETIDSETTVQVEECEYDPSYWEISGVVEDNLLETESHIFLQIQENEETRQYEAFTISNETDDDGYLLYLPKENLTSGDVNVRILVKTDGTDTVVKEQAISQEGVSDTYAME